MAAEATTGVDLACVPAGEHGTAPAPVGPEARPRAPTLPGGRRRPRRAPRRRPPLAATRAPAGAGEGAAPTDRRHTLPLSTPFSSSPPKPSDSSVLAVRKRRVLRQLTGYSAPRAAAALLEASGEQDDGAQVGLRGLEAPGPRPTPGKGAPCRTGSARGSGNRRRLVRLKSWVPPRRPGGGAGPILMVERGVCGPVADPDLTSYYRG